MGEIMMARRDFAIADVLPGKLNALVKTLMDQMKIDDPNEAVQRVNSGEWVVRKLELLQERGRIQVPEGIDSFTPSEYFQNRDDLLVSEGFRELILSATETLEKMPAAEIRVFDLVKSMTHGQIRVELPEGHVFELSEYFSLLARLIEWQKDGEVGYLLTNGSATFAYVRGINSDVFAVGVCWDADDCQWYTSAFRLHDSPWYVDGQVFSRH